MLNLYYISYMSQVVLKNRTKVIITFKTIFFVTLAQTETVLL